MIKAVFLDLDNTLLDNPQDVFVREYLLAADRFFEEQWQCTVSGALLKSMRVIAAPRDLRHVNSDLVLKVVSDELGRPVSDILSLFEDFYQTHYPALQQFTNPVPFASELISQLRRQQFAVVIATNPIYPTEAIRQRLAWANLSDNLEQYAFVTHADNMHHAKPDPAYYAEILARVGVEPDEVLMVGDSLESDIVPAAAVGLHTYHLRTTNTGGGSGTLEDVYNLIRTENWTQSLPARRLVFDMVEPQLRGNLGALYGLLAQVKPPYWHQHPDPKEWSIMQIICHLLESEQTVQYPRLKRILDENNPFLAVPRTPAGPEVDPCDTDGYRVADGFVRERKATLAFLHALRPEEWIRPARHSIFGPTTLLEMAHFTAQHDRLHLNQFCHTLGKCE